MRLFIFFFLLMQCITAKAQTLCTKFTVIKPIVRMETKKVLQTPAVYETRYTDIIVKEGYWDVESKNGLPCKTWREPIIESVAEQFMVQAAIYKDIQVQKTVRNAEVTAYVSDCNN